MSRISDVAHSLLVSEFKTLNMPEMCPTSADLASSLMIKSHLTRACASVSYSFPLGNSFPFQGKTVQQAFIYTVCMNAHVKRDARIKLHESNPILNNFLKRTFLFYGCNLIFGILLKR